MPSELKKVMERISAEISKVVLGQQETIILLMVGLLARGHLLLEGVPGIGKTLLAKTFAYLLRAEFTRIQFTPDLMPADILGTSVYDLESRTFRLRKGPVFTDILLADEINRTPPKTQAALLEAMEERQVTIDGKTIPLSERFIVLATQNPIEQEGTYPLPEAQLDRFLMKIRLGYPAAGDEREIIGRYGRAQSIHPMDGTGLSRLPEGDWAKSLRRYVGQVRMEEGIVGYVQTLLEETRRSPHLHLGASTRAGIALLKSSQCLAALEGKEFITPDHVKKLAPPVLRHRLILRPEAELEGLGADAIIGQILNKVPVPR
ncbi:MAG: magnesium chelatase [Deltaproteobacteria bacterium HGW-Deltaproteobacteria-15]|jgi:MoxR-like ATPase|nr:MAG: magnesium chelatase [Deltaproteobacteria bacterium HGW-Deltaproteobacteria-15]